MITVKSYITREINKLKKKRKQLKAELLTLSQSGTKEMFANTNIILEKELIVISGKIDAFTWVANTNQKSLPKIKNKKKKKKIESIEPVKDVAKTKH